MILGIFTIFGHSMLPVLHPSDRVLVSFIPYYFSTPKKGDIVLFKKNGMLIVKRIVKSENGKISVAGDNKKDSLYNSTVRRKDIVGKMIYKF